MDDIAESLAHPAALELPCILLLLGEHSSHGYELIERLKEFGVLDNGTGRVYRELRQLEDAGLVHSVWEVSQIRGPARRVYELTRQGRDLLSACAESAARLAGTVECYVPRARAVCQRPPPVRS